MSVPGWSDSQGYFGHPVLHLCTPSCMGPFDGLKGSASMVLAAISVYSTGRRLRGSKRCRPVANRKVSIAIRLSGQGCSKVRLTSLSLLILSGRQTLTDAPKKKKIPLHATKDKRSFLVPAVALCGKK